jgi:hypothetical protein
MAVIARDSQAADALVYAWPYPLGGEPHEVNCGADEVAVMCPAWVLGDRLGPGRHPWRTPDPSRPTSAFFVLTGPVEVPFDLTASFLLPSTHQPVRLRAHGSLLARCYDPALLVSQFVGLPADDVNGGLLRSIARSAERLLTRVLVRRVLAAGTPMAVLDPALLGSIVEEAAAYNPACGAVTGLMFVRFAQLHVLADDGNRGWSGGPVSWPSAHNASPYPTGGYAAQPYPSGAMAPAPAYGAPLSAYDATPTGPPVSTGSPTIPPAVISSDRATGGRVAVSGEIGVVSGEIGAAPRDAGVVSGEIRPRRTTTPAPAVAAPEPAPAAAAGAAPTGLLPAGARVLLPSPDGSLQAATIVRHDHGYYQVEVGASGEQAWVPAGQVIPQ